MGIIDVKKRYKCKVIDTQPPVLFSDLQKMKKGCIGISMSNNRSEERRVGKEC